MFDKINKGQYWDHALTLVEGCTPVSAGCDNCWSAAMAHRFKNKGQPENHFHALTNAQGKWMGKIITRPDRLALPLKVRKPTVWAVWNDLFHEDVPDKFIAAVLWAMAMCPHHIFIILTKRPQNMVSIYRWLQIQDCLTPQEMCALHANEILKVPTTTIFEWPLPNVYLGVTAENQEYFDIRWKCLKMIPAAQIMISYEPALGQLILPDDFLERGKNAWFVAGGETGPHARPVHPDWVRSLRDQCQAAGVPFFFKQWGEWLGFHPDHNGIVYEDRATGETKYMMHNGRKYDIYWSEDGDVMIFAKVGKKAAGHALDGREWLQLPEGF